MVNFCRGPVRNAARHKRPNPQVFLKMIIFIFYQRINRVLGFTLSVFVESLADMKLEFVLW